MLKKLHVAAVFFAFAILSMPPFTSYCDSRNLISNPGFETVNNNLPSGWYTSAYVNASDAVEFLMEDESPHSGNRCFTIINKKPNDSRVCQNIEIVPGSIYKASYWLKVDHITPGSGGANITFENGIYYSDFIFDTGGQWQKFEHYIKTDPNGDEVLRFWVRLGGFGSVTEGKVSFDDISVELVENPDASAKIEYCFAPKTETGISGSNGTERGAPVTAMLYLIVGSIIIAFIIRAENRLIKINRNKEQSIETERQKEQDNDYNEDTNIS